MGGCGRWPLATSLYSTKLTPARPSLEALGGDDERSVGLAGRYGARALSTKAEEADRCPLFDSLEVDVCPEEAGEGRDRRDSIGRNHRPCRRPKGPV